MAAPRSMVRGVSRRSHAALGLQGQREREVRMLRFVQFLIFAQVAMASSACFVRARPDSRREYREDRREEKREDKREDKREKHER